MTRYLDIWTAEKIGVNELTGEAIRAYQLDKIKETVKKAAANSPFYAKLYNGVEIDSWEAFERIPFTCAEDIRKYGMDMVCVPQSRISRIVTMDTSGTTGSPKRIFFTEADQELTVDFFHNGMQLLVEPSDAVMILMPCRSPGSIGDLLNKGLLRLGAKTVCYGLPDGTDDEKILSVMEKEQVTCCVALASQLASLAQKSESYQIPMKSVLLSAEYVSETNRHLIANAWNCRVFEHYGMTEMGLGGAVSCPQLEGYHIRESDLYIEIIDPDTGMVLPDGEIGEVVFTTLTREGMPMIRYRTGDISSIMPEPCKCGSVLKRLSRVGDRCLSKGHYFNKGE